MSSTEKISYLDEYQSVCSNISKIVTKRYSTSFYWASQFFSKEIQKGIFNIYGFVRFVDEIVDSFHDFDKEKLLDSFEKEYRDALFSGMSLNPIIYSYIHTCKQYHIEEAYTEAFLQSMRFDLTKSEYSNAEEINQYIYGSAEVIGLMCLKIFCNGNQKYFDSLKPQALKLGAAFQKVNFLRDIKNDTLSLNRTYFPEMVIDSFNEKSKELIITDIENDFRIAKKGICLLPRSSRLAVLIAYLYYKELLHKLKKSSADKILSTRIRVPNFHKLFLIFKALLLNIFT
ncbi:MAG TPA: phytoene/squalene synthase family protein [Bacteroidales bacterium]|nr:phytoene/squalene synthase family protein [Bacteroidales bacterium]